ncbi:hypothetical protein DCAR_0414865 [Daucus carota subsp. sativus]|uniref:MYB transcription factor n=1 Tax=Daucus carota subsp. sativus TaxID=79200 RepID=A0AAF0WVB9_DAUCS|nr:hypothetical protein DCAR_0414865 [Daucus carota subsp. sativus]
MGAPKQKWTSEEEAALKAGVKKHGAGKWRTILKDPEFSGDKLRNMSVIANGWGSGEKARLALKTMHQSSRDDDNSVVFVYRILIGQSYYESNNQLEPVGSNKIIIGTYIEKQYWAPPNFKRLLSAKLKFLTNTGRLIKIKRYKIASTSVSSDKRKQQPSMLLLERKQRSYKLMMNSHI